jgi:NCAIR mutase (PurE)-related protein
MTPATPAAPAPPAAGGRVAEEIRLDFDRRRRTGMDEAVFAAGKSLEQLEAIFAAAERAGAALLLTRLAADRLAALHAEYRERIDYCAISRTGIFEPRPGSRAVRSGGAEACLHLGAGAEGCTPIGASAEGCTPIGASAEACAHVGAGAEGCTHIGAGAEGCTHIGASAEGCTHSSASAEGCTHSSASAEGCATVALVAGGSSDVPVLREAERTLEFHGVASRAFIDVGVAGLWRLTQQLPAIAACPVVIAVAGMEAALPTVLAGLIPSSIIAVPTSVGYGVAAGGDAALNAILASCAPGLVAVNIDNGYGAACAALRVLQAGIAQRSSQRSSIHNIIGSTPSWNAAHSSSPPLPESA